MEIKYQKHSIRKARAKIFWKQVVDLYHEGVRPAEIARMFINPYTGKHYHEKSIYYILKQMSKSEDSKGGE